MIALPPVKMRHTAALTYSWLERLHRRVYGSWPQSVVQRRLHAYDLDCAETLRQTTEYLRERDT